MLNHFGLLKLLNKVAHPDQCLSLLVYHSSLVKTDIPFCRAGLRTAAPAPLFSRAVLHGVFNKPQWTHDSLITCT